MRKFSMSTAFVCLIVVALLPGATFAADLRVSDDVSVLDGTDAVATNEVTDPSVEHFGVELELEVGVDAQVEGVVDHGGSLDLAIHTISRDQCLGACRGEWSQCSSDCEWDLICLINCDRAYDICTSGCY